jgi:hypothetical protein
MMFTRAGAFLQETSARVRDDCARAGRIDSMRRETVEIGFAWLFV